MTDKELAVIDVLCGNSKAQWSLCDTSCSGCNFYFEDSDMGAVVPICIHGFGKSRNSCDYYMIHKEYSQLVRSCIANLKTENAKLRELVRLMWKPFCWAQSGCEVCLTDEQDAEIRDKVRELEVEVD